MGRVAGPGKAKEALLHNLSPSTFVDLVADILYFVRKHRDVRVFDGPGDGGRDIGSVAPDGLEHITQCKYRATSARPVGAREADEIGRTLTKFGATRGCVATNGRISPQAKRELTDAYPALDVTYMEGVDVVDAIASNPTLSAMWLRRDKIVRVRHALIQPFIVRHVLRDCAIPVDVRPSKRLKGWSIHRAFLRSDVFAPYAPPRRPNVLEGIFLDTVGCYVGVLPRAHSMSDLERLRAAIRETVFDIKDKTEDWPTDMDPWTVRFGSPFLSTSFTRSEQERFELPRGAMRLDQSAHSEVLAYFETTPERDWVLPDRSSWVLPEAATGTVQQQIRWYNRELDLALRIEVESAVSPRDRSNAEWLYNLREPWWRRSLFLAIPAEGLAGPMDCDAPTRVDDYFGGRKLACWLHPLADSMLLPTFGMDENAAFEKTESEFEEDAYVEKFEVVKERVLASFPHGERVEPDAARHVLAAQGHDPLPHYWSVHYESFDLAFTFGEAPSPMRLARRAIYVELGFVVSAPPKAALSRVRDLLGNQVEEVIPFDEEGEGPTAFLAVRRVEPGPHMACATAALLVMKQDEILAWAEKVEASLRQEWPLCARTTGGFLNAVGLYVGPATASGRRPRGELRSPP